MTKKQFKTRNKEHIADAKYNKKTTALTKVYDKKPLQIEKN